MSYTMNNNLVNYEECIQVDRGCSVVDYAALLHVDAGSCVAPAEAPSAECGEDAELDNRGYQVVTRARRKKAGNANAPSNNNGPSTAFRFTQPVEASKKRRAEEQLGDAARRTSVIEQIQSLKNLMVQLIDQNEKQQDEIEKQREVIGALRQEVEGVRKLLQQNNTGKATYATELTTGMQKVHTAAPCRPSQPDIPKQPQRMRVEDDKCAMTINTSRYKGEKTVLVQVRATLQQDVDSYTALEGVKIRCLRQLSVDNINVVFQTEGEAKKAREDPGWLMVAIPEASVKSETWFPIKCDMVAKSMVTDPSIDGGRTLRKEACAEFAVDNRSNGIDFTAMKARWLSKADRWKKTESLVIWLKNRDAADHLLKAGEAFFGGGASGAYCSTSSRTRPTSFALTATDMAISKQCARSRRDAGSVRERTRSGAARARNLRSAPYALDCTEAPTGNACDTRTTRDTWPHKPSSQAIGSSPRRVKASKWRTRYLANVRAATDTSLQRGQAEVSSMEHVERRDTFRIHGTRGGGAMPLPQSRFWGGAVREPRTMATAYTDHTSRTMN
ncbi:hypothetical protein K458DRAFT_464363 [Lentithecium fluviatile CBS 122367]|uniref:Uncharacterized protein n=1 Tax=Lentithecium fluviatile CBS 122367 TaxID=1168545 RepID=A0A6G1IJ16_9PLEO|nr:hypothetical protein K458DRAFT_464363 [Lentithecium fluviatile CBS 122367]